tara:strand:- start:49246 stop:49437 length:192 start_codon:yes stop_codon:yes gene_type:complete
MKKLLSALFAILTLVSCSNYEGQEVLPTDQVNGPGLFTGEKGEFEISINDHSKKTSYKREKLK